MGSRVQVCRDRLSGPPLSTRVGYHSTSGHGIRPTDGWVRVRGGFGPVDSGRGIPTGR